MKFALGSQLLLLSILVLPSTLMAQLDDIDGVKNYGYWVNEIKDGADAPGIQSLRWRTRTIEAESRLIKQKIDELKTAYERTSQQQQEVEQLLSRNRVGENIPARLLELDHRAVLIESELAALAAEQESLKRRGHFELQAEDREKILAEKQANILQDMLALKRQELERTEKLVDKAMASPMETARLAKDLKEIELRIIENSAEADRQAFIAEEIQAKLGETEAKSAALKKQPQSILDQRKTIADSREHVNALPRLKFEQELTLKMIENSSLRVLDLELESIRYRALLKLVEDELKKAPVSENDD